MKKTILILLSCFLFFCSCNPTTSKLFIDNFDPNSKQHSANAIALKENLDSVIFTDYEVIGKLELSNLSFKQWYSIDEQNTIKQQLTKIGSEQGADELFGFNIFPAYAHNTGKRGNYASTLAVRKKNIENEITYSKVMIGILPIEFDLKNEFWTDERLSEKLKPFRKAWDYKWNKPFDFTHEIQRPIEKLGFFTFRLDTFLFRKKFEEINTREIRSRNSIPLDYILRVKVKDSEFRIYNRVTIAMELYSIKDNKVIWSDEVTRGVAIVGGIIQAHPLSESHLALIDAVKEIVQNIPVELVPKNRRL